ncbi:MAG: hypothetical protein Q6366_009260 [Candidatus Freyarchaeota archaeon]
MERAPKAEGFIVIGGRVYPANQVLQALITEGFADIKIEEGSVLIIGGARIPPIFKSPQEQAMATTCYGSLAYCCSLEKPCENRDRALELLGLSKEDYFRLKTYLHNKFIEYSKGLTINDLGPRYYEPKESAKPHPYRNKPITSSDLFENAENIEHNSISPTPKEKGSHTAESISDLFNHSEEMNQNGSNYPQNYGSTTPFSENDDEFSFCIYCGSRLPPKARYCKKCGKPAI